MENNEQPIEPELREMESRLRDHFLKRKGLDAMFAVTMAVRKGDVAEEDVPAALAHYREHGTLLEKAPKELGLREGDYVAQERTEHYSTGEMSSSLSLRLLAFVRSISRPLAMGSGFLLLVSVLGLIWFAGPAGDKAHLTDTTELIRRDGLPRNLAIDFTEQQVRWYDDGVELSGKLGALAPESGPTNRIFSVILSGQDAGGIKAVFRGKAGLYFKSAQDRRLDAAELSMAKLDGQLEIIDKSTNSVKTTYSRSGQ